jgi:lipid II:glycine glycyltransferase (peptidoglycan interpeptide bridge formation enzyme)
MLEVKEWSDQPSWDAFVGSQRTGHFNQGWGWGELAAPLGGRIHRFAVVDGMCIHGALSVVINPIRRTGYEQLYVSRGPAVDEPSEEIFSLFSSALESTAARSKGIVAKIEPYVPAGDRQWPALLRSVGFEPLYPPSQPRSVWLLDLQPSLDDLLAGMKSKWRYNVRLAQRKGVEVTAGCEADFDDFYGMYRETARRDGFFIHDEWVYRGTFERFWRLGQFHMLVARFGGRPIAAVTLVHLGRTVWYLHGASTNEHREVMAPHLLQWEAITWARQQGAETYDFRGVPDVPSPDQEMVGVYRFKQGFGGRQVTCLEQYARGFRPPLFQLWQGYWKSRYVMEEISRLRSGRQHRPWA